MELVQPLVILGEIPLSQMSCQNRGVKHTGEWAESGNFCWEAFRPCADGQGHPLLYHTYHCASSVPQKNVSHLILHRSHLIYPTCEIPDPPLGAALASSQEKKPDVASCAKQGGSLQAAPQGHEPATWNCESSISENYPAFAVVGGSSLFGSSSSSLYSQEENHHAENHTFLFPRY